MGKKATLGAQYFIAGYDLSGDVGSLPNIASPRTPINVTPINKSAFERLLGHGEGQMQFNTYFNDASNQEHDALKGLPTADVDALFSISSTAGDVSAALRGKQVNYDWNRTADGGLIGAVQVLGSAGVALEWGTLVSAGKVTHASATDGPSVDNGASTSDGAAGFLQAISCDSGTPTYILQDSADDAAFATLVSFGAVAAGSHPTTARGTATGTVNRYLRPQTTGTFTNAVFVMAVRRGTAQDDTAY